MKEKNTIEFLNLLKNTKSLNELEDYLNSIDNCGYDGFSEYILEKCREKNLSKSSLIKNSGLNRTYGYQILNGDKNPSRDKIIQLCFGASLNIEETDKALTLAKMGKLYAKDKRDSAIIFAINQKLSLDETNDFLYEIDKRFVLGYDNE